MSTEKNILEIIELMRRDDSVDAPADSIRWAGNLFRSRAAEPRTSFVKKLAAVLQMELTPNKPAFGERSASASQVRQMLYQAADNAIDLRIEPQPKGFGIRGQVLGDGFAGASIRLFSDARSLETTANEMSEFALESVPTGEYELTILSDGFEISLKAIVIE
jgi:hypothetical protein